MLGERETMSEPTTSPETADTPDEAENPHARSVRKIADAMLRTAIWPAVATVVVGTLISTIWVGVPGLAGGLVGGAVGFASSLATIWMMRVTAASHPMFAMVVALAGYVGKMLVLLILMTALGGVEVLHREALALTMLATILVWAGAEVRAFQKTKIPTVVPAGKA